MSQSVFRQTVPSTISFLPSVPAASHKGCHPTAPGEPEIPPFSCQPQPLADNRMQSAAIIIWEHPEPHYNRRRIFPPPAVWPHRSSSAALNCTEHIRMYIPPVHGPKKAPLPPQKQASSSCQLSAEVLLCGTCEKSKIHCTRLFRPQFPFYAFIEKRPPAPADR